MDSINHILVCNGNFTNIKILIRYNYHFNLHLSVRAILSLFLKWKPVKNRPGRKWGFKNNVLINHFQNGFCKRLANRLTNQ